MAVVQEDESSAVDKKAFGSRLGDGYRIPYFPLVCESICLLGGVACQPVQYAHTLSPRTRVEKIPPPSLCLWKPFIDDLLVFRPYSIYIIKMTDNKIVSIRTLVFYGHG